MSNLKILALAAVAAVTLSFGAEAASLTNGPNGTQPNTMASRTRTGGVNSKMPSRAIMHRRHR